MSDNRWVTFDCYGTLVDWRHGIATLADLVAPGRGTQLLEAYNRHEPQVQQASPTPRYRHVLTETLRLAAAEQKINLLDDDADVLAAGIPYWPVFPEVRQALEELRIAGWNLALLTNCDRDLVAQTQRRLVVPLDAVITAEDSGAYKPAHNHFTRFSESFEPAQWVHVAQSYFHDIVPAHALGITRIWVNRLGEPDDPALADAVIDDLTGLAAHVTRVATPQDPARG